MALLLLAEGQKHDVFFWTPDAQEAFDFFSRCPNATPADIKKITKAIPRFADHGNPHNAEKFKPVEDGLFEIKPTSQIRLIGFFDGTKFVIVNCVRKKQDNLRPEDVEKAKRLRSDYEQVRN